MTEPISREWKNNVGAFGARCTRRRVAWPCASRPSEPCPDVRRAYRDVLRAVDRHIADAEGDPALQVFWLVAWRNFLRESAHLSIPLDGEEATAEEGRCSPPARVSLAGRVVPLGVRDMAPFRTILFATDLSEHSDHYFGIAGAVARNCGGRLLVVHVAEPDPSPAPHHVGVTYSPLDGPCDGWGLGPFLRPEPNRLADHPGDCLRARETLAARMRGRYVDDALGRGRVSGD